MEKNVFDNAEIRTKNLFCEFTSDERADKADQLADKRIRMDELKDEAAALNKEKGDLDKEILSISKLLKVGGEERFVKCLVVYNYPEDGSKTFKRSDTGEEWVETMVDADFKFFNEEEQEQPKILQLPPASLESVFGFNPDEDGFEYFVPNTVEDFAEHGIELSKADLRKYARKLYVKASFQDITKLTDKSYQGKFNTDISNVYWYMFEPIVDLDEIEEAEAKEVDESLKVPDEESEGKAIELDKETVPGEDEENPNAAADDSEDGIVDDSYEIVNDENEEQAPENEIFSEEEVEQQNKDWAESLAEEEAVEQDKKENE